MAIRDLLDQFCAALAAAGAVSHPHRWTIDPLHCSAGAVPTLQANASNEPNSATFKWGVHDTTTSVQSGRWTSRSAT